MQFDPSQPPEPAEVSAALEDFDFQAHGPLEFIAFLREHYARLASSGTAGARLYGHTSGARIAAGSRPADLPALEALLDVREPCLAVVKETCSFLPTEPSTVAREAAFLIAGYHAERDGTGYGGYRLRLSSAQ